jgi:hypothetical protein
VKVTGGRFVGEGLAAGVGDDEGAARRPVGECAKELAGASSSSAGG